MAKQTKKSTKKKSQKSLFNLSINDLKLLGALLAVFILIILYFIVLDSNVRIKSEKYFVYIPPNSSSKELAEFLKKEEVINNAISFEIMADWRDFKPKKKGGLLEVRKNWNNYQLISALKTDSLLPAKVLTLPRVRLRSNMINEVIDQLKLNRNKFRALLKDSALLAELNMEKESIYSIFIPGTYYVPLDSLDERELIEVLYGEFEHFFNKERMEKANKANLEPEEAVILASIVYCETKKLEEMPLIAGVYVNRLKKNMRLEADPTLVYATQDYNARRVYKNKKQIYPLYNTYSRKGLPPGPIHFPPPEVIDQVLNFNDHEFLYFCAKDDTTGTHSFASTYEDHKLNADRYRQYLNSKKIY